MLRIPEEIIDAIEAIHLPTIPQTVVRFMQMADDENTSIAELATLVGRDPALTARVLTVANSAALRGRGGSKDLAGSLASIGICLARTLAASLVVQNVFSPALDGQEYDFAGFWWHSIQVAEVARAIAVEINYPDVEEAHLAGLLHNIGQLLMLGGLKGRYGLLLAASSDESVLRNREQMEFGTNHSAMGAWLVDQWSLSSFMADAILFHHAASDEIAAADTLSQIVWSAHKICHHHTKSDPLQQVQDADFTTVHSFLGLNASTIFYIYQDSSLRVARYAADLDITESVDAKTFPYPTTIPLENSRPLMKNKETAYAQMVEMAHDLAMLQPLQRLFASLQSETEMLLSIRESAWILFGPGPFAFLMVQPGKAVLSGAKISGQSLLLQQIKIPLDSDQSLATGVALGKKTSSSTFDQESPAAIPLADVQIRRILGSEGLLYIPLKSRARIIGLMVYGVSASHCARLKKSLRLMTRFANTAASCLENLRETQEHLRSMLIGRMSDVTGESTVTGSVDINTLIESMLELHGDMLFTSRGINIEKDLDAGLSAVASDRDRISQILYCLWKNASEATAAGGYFAISTHDNINQDGRFFVEIRQSDTGPGLPPAVMQRLFQLPASDKKRSGHVGLGLTIVAELVEQIGGRITCQSKTGRGTRFSILIPKTGNT